MRNHREQDDVKVILKKSQNEQKKFFEMVRVQGIYDFNVKQLSKKEEEHQLMRERQPKYEDSVRLCSVCKKFISSRTFYKHKQSCNKQSATPIKPQTLVSQIKSFTMMRLSKLKF